MTEVSRGSGEEVIDQMQMLQKEKTFELLLKGWVGIY